MYDEIQKLPFAAFFDRMRTFLGSPDTLLLTCGFSFFDAHVSAVIDEALAANPAASVFAFQYGTLADEVRAAALALKRPNMSVYARDGAVINCIPGPWKLGPSLSSDWDLIRTSFWEKPGENDSEIFLLGDFGKFARFFALYASGGRSQN